MFAGRGGSLAGEARMYDETGEGGRAVSLLPDSHFWKDLHTLVSPFPISWAEFPDQWKRGVPSP